MHLDEWLKTAKISQSELARLLGVTPGAISQWMTKGEVPVARVLALESITGIPRHALRPDFYPPERINIPASGPYKCDEG